MVVLRDEVELETRGTTTDGASGKFVRLTGLPLPMFSCHVGHLEHKGRSLLSFHGMHEASLWSMSGLLSTARRACIRRAKVDGHQGVLAQWLGCMSEHIGLVGNVQCGHSVLLECHVERFICVIETNNLKGKLPAVPVCCWRQCRCDSPRAVKRAMRKAFYCDCK